MADKKGLSKNKLITSGVALIAAIAAAVFGGKSLLGDDSTDNKDNIPAVTTTAGNAARETDVPAENKAEEPKSPAAQAQTDAPAETEPEIEVVNYTFYSDELLESHFEKHGHEFGGEFGYFTAEDYEQGASDVINDPDALYKTEKEDGDGVYYIPETNEFVVLSTNGYIRTYFRPTDGMDYYERQQHIKNPP